MIDAPWSHVVRLSAIGQGLQLSLVPDESVRVAMARADGLVALKAFDAQLELAPWFDGYSLAGRWRATVTQVCGVTLELFDSELGGELDLKYAPKGSSLLPPDDAEIVIDPEGEDPPDVLDGDAIDVGAALCEQLTLEIDPYPRKPGAVFVQPETSATISPFAKLAALKAVEPKDE
jgi:hypothetical protein